MACPSNKLHTSAMFTRAAPAYCSYKFSRLGIAMILGMNKLFLCLCSARRSPSVYPHQDIQRNKSLLCTRMIKGISLLRALQRPLAVEAHGDFELSSSSNFACLTAPSRWKCALSEQNKVSNVWETFCNRFTMTVQFCCLCWCFRGWY